MKHGVVGLLTIFLVISLVFMKEIFRIKILPLLFLVLGLVLIFVGTRIVLLKKAFWPGFQNFIFILLQYRFPKTPSEIKKQMKPIKGSRVLFLGCIYIIVGALIIYFSSSIFFI